MRVAPGVVIAMLASVNAQNVGKSKSIVVYAVLRSARTTRISREITAWKEVVFFSYIFGQRAVSSVEIVQSTGYPELDKSSIAAFSKWRFLPPGRPTKLKMPITFTMKRPPALPAGSPLSGAYRAIPE